MNKVQPVYPCSAQASQVVYVYAMHPQPNAQDHQQKYSCTKHRENPLLCTLHRFHLWPMFVDEDNN